MRKTSSEAGSSFLEILVSLGIVSFLFMSVTTVMSRLVVSSESIKDRLQVMESLIEVEDFMRKEIQELQFVPYCSELLPAYSNALIGGGLDSAYRDSLHQSIRISRPQEVARESVLNMAHLRGSGSGGYAPAPNKVLAGIVQGSDVFHITGLLPTGLRLGIDRFEGELSQNLVGVRNVVFYVTDCQRSMILRAQRQGDAFELSRADLKMLQEHFELVQLHIYVVQEYLFYTQLQAGEASLVVDFLDGQAFLRVPSIVDFRVGFDEGSLLSIHLLGAKKSRDEVEGIVVEGEEYYRIVQNAQKTDYRYLVIGLE